MVVQGHDYVRLHLFKCLSLTNHGNFVLCMSLKSAINSASTDFNACYAQAMLYTFAKCFAGKSHANSNCYLIV